MLADALTFATLVLPPGYRYVVTGFRSGPTGQPKPEKTSRCGSLDEVVAAAASLAGVQGLDVYFALGGFDPRTATRRRPDLRRLKALWLDIDVGKPGGVATQADARDQLEQLVRGHALPPPSAIVSSGGGLHVYWALAVPVDPVLWAGYAAALKALVCNAAPLLAADTSTWTVPTSVLRWPGTWNYKQPTPRPVELVAGTLEPVDLAELRAIAPKVAARALAGARTRAPTPVPAGTQTLDFDSRQRVAARVMVAQCAALRAHLSREQAGSADYQAWLYAVWLAAYTTDGAAAAHAWSQGPKYDAGKVDEVFDAYCADRRQQERATGAYNGPVTCESFCNAAGAKQTETCVGCPLYGKHSSPAHVERTMPLEHKPLKIGEGHPDCVPGLLRTSSRLPRFLTADLSERYAASPYAVVTDPSPGHPPGFVTVLPRVDADGRPIELARDKDGKVIGDPFFTGPLFNKAWWLTHSISDGASGVVIYHGLRLESGNLQAITLPGKETSKPADLFKALANVGVRRCADGRLVGDEAMRYFETAEAEVSHDARKTVSQLGWQGTEKDAPFALGGVLVSLHTPPATGDVVPEPVVQYSPYAPVGALASLGDTPARGTVLGAIGAAREFFDGLDPTGKVLLLTPFASNLLQLAGLQAPTVVMTGATGVGKSTMLDVCASMFAASATSVIASDSTHLGSQDASSACGTNVACWEEASEGARIFERVFHTGDRGARTSKRSDGKEGLVVRAAHKGMVLAAANTSIADIVSRSRADGTRSAALARVLEVPLLQSMFVAGSKPDCLERLRENEGMLGLYFIQYVLRNRAQIAARIDYWRTRAADRAGAAANARRFITTWQAVMMAAAEVLGAIDALEYTDPSGAMDTLETYLHDMMAADAALKARMDAGIAPAVTLALALNYLGGHVVGYRAGEQFPIAGGLPNGRHALAKSVEFPDGRKVYTVPEAVLRDVFANSMKDPYGRAFAATIAAGVADGVVASTGSGQHRKPRMLDVAIDALSPPLPCLTITIQGAAPAASSTGAVSQ